MDVSSYKIPVRLKIRTEHGKRRRREIEIEHPIILLSHWMASLLVTFPKFFLAGICPERDGPDAYMDIFSRFWERFEWSQPDHPVYQKTQKERSCTIPIAIHGDEGRGLAKVPLLVIAYQVIIPYSGENHLSSSKYPDLTIYKLFEIWFPIFPKIPHIACVPAMSQFGTCRHKALLHHPASIDCLAFELVRQEGCQRQCHSSGLG